MKVAVIGAGVAGLSAAYDLRTAGAEVVVVEASDRVGGKLRSAQIAGVNVDVGAEAMLARHPDGVGLAGELGLEIVHPTRATSRIWTRGALRPLPRTLMGVPMDLDQLEATGILSPEGMARAREEAALPVDDAAGLAEDGDLAVGDLVDRRFGPEVTDQLVEPLLGGVYAGRARDLSLRATVPQLVALAAAGPLTPQVTAMAATYVARASDAPVFACVAGGMGRLPEALAVGLDIRTGAGVRDLARTARGFELTVGEDEHLVADAVVVATPARAASRLLRATSVGRSALLADLDYASSAVVTFAFRAEDLPLDGAESGFLVPPHEGRFIKASTFSFAKWAWVREAGDGLLFLRTSVGRDGELGALDHTDAELVGRSLADLREAIGPTGEPVDTHVQRWVDGLPQYRAGHLRAVAQLYAAVAEVPGLAVCGAAYDGVGIPVVIASGRRAAARVLAA